MYEYLKGQVTFVCPYYIVLEVKGVGFQVQVANPFQYSAIKAGDQTLYVHQVVREDAETLYGFKTLTEKRLFLKLISVSGIGPKSALAIMASDDHAGLVQAIETGDNTYLTKFPGVGKKTAQQMVLDLKDKLGELGIVTASAPLAASEVLATNADLTEALEALQALGYSAKEIQRVEKLLKMSPSLTTEEYLRQGLKLLMKK